MANVHADGTVEAHGFSFHWDLDFIDAADTVTINVQHTHLADGTPANEVPSVATFRLEDNGSRTVIVDCLTGKFAPGTNPSGIVGQNFSQTHSGSMLNAGPISRTGVRLKVSTDRAAGIESGSQYTAPG